MKKINVLLTLLSLNTLLVIFERISPTTSIILGPYSFLRVHEVLQIIVITLICVILSFLILKLVTNNFETTRSRDGSIYLILYIIGLYFFATGNGLHEVSSHLYNTFCDTQQTALCQSIYFNNFFAGNFIYFSGFFMSNLAILLLERKNPVKNFTKNDVAVTILNSFVLSFSIFVYTSYDQATFGLIFVTLTAGIILVLLATGKSKLTELPFTLYCGSAFLLATIASIFVRIFK